MPVNSFPERDYARKALPGILRKAYQDYLWSVTENDAPRATLVEFPYPMDTPKYKGTPEVPPEQHIHPSDLGGCPRAAACKRRKIPFTNPMSADKYFSRLHLFEQGIRDAEPMQEALYQEAGFVTEVSIRAVIADHVMSGRMDAFTNTTHLKGWDEYEDLQSNPPPVIVEIKRRDIPEGQQPTVRRSYVMQIAAYMMMIHQLTGRTPVGAVVTMNRYYVESWPVVWQTFDDESYFTVHDEFGQPLFSVPEKEIEAAIRAIAAFSEMEESALSSSPAPVGWKNPTNHDEGWRCASWENGKPPLLYKKEYQGRTERTENLVPRCEHFCLWTPIAAREYRQLPDGSYEGVDDAKAD